MREIPEEVLYDIRLIERYISKGLITRDQVNEQMAKVGDATDLSERIGIEGTTADGSGTEMKADPESTQDPA